MKSKFYFFTAILILAAVFTGCNKETYTVTFNPNGGTGTMQPQTFTEGEAQALTRNAFTYDGYTFTGWNTVQGGSGISYPDGQTITATMDMTLYAQWTSNGTNPTQGNIVTVTFDANGGTGEMTPQTFIIGTAQTLIANMFTNTGYTFTGWNTLQDGSGASYTDQSVITVMTDLVLYAQWTNSTIGTLNGHDWVDLGLQSGLLWATCNVGSDTPEGGGYAYVFDGTIAWAGGWYKPTRTDFQDLIDMCTKTFTAQNGVNGCLFTGPNGNSIFLPNGCYWSRTYVTSDSGAYALQIMSGSCGIIYRARDFTFRVRAVCQN